MLNMLRRLGKPFGKPERSGSGMAARMRATLCMGLRMDEVPANSRTVRGTKALSSMAFCRAKRRNTFQMEIGTRGILLPGNAMVEALTTRQAGTGLWAGMRMMSSTAEGCITLPAVHVSRACFSKVGVMDREFSIISTVNLSPFATNMDVGFLADFTLI